MDDKQTERSRRRVARRERFRLAQERAGSSAGRLPDFVIIGAQKGGTTTLFRMLAEHPLVERPAMKEVHFFDAAFDEGVGWYESHFPAPSEIDGSPTLTGESTPYYLYDPLAPERAAETVPGARLIVLLRNPVDRAYSHYHHERTRGNERLGFGEAVAAEAGRLAGGGDFARRHHSYVDRGMYAGQLARWREHFAPERILVLRSEDLFANPRDALLRALRFLGLPRFEPPRTDPQNPGGYEEGPGQEIRRRLEARFAAPNRELYELIGADFGW